MQKDGKDCLFPMPDHFKVEISFKDHFKARNAGAYPGVVQTGAADICYEADDWTEVLRMLDFVL
jgi:D-amino peptidase